MAGELLAAVEQLDRSVWALRFWSQGPPGAGFVYRTRRGQGGQILIEQWDHSALEWDTGNPFLATHDAQWTTNFAQARQTAGGAVPTRRVPAAEINLVTNATDPPGRYWTDNE